MDQANKKQANVRNSIALTSIVVTELATTMTYGGGVLYNFVFTEVPFKTVSGDVTAFHRMTATDTWLNSTQTQ